jgi:hypothetical protein
MRCANSTILAPKFQRSYQPRIYAEKRGSDNHCNGNPRGLSETGKMLILSMSNYLLIRVHPRKSAADNLSWAKNPWTLTS